MASSSTLLAKYFDQLKDLPCWLGSSEFGTWLSLNYGQPYVRICERKWKSDAKSDLTRKRRVFLQSDFMLWFEMGEWEYFENGKPKFNSGQSRAYLPRAAARLESQCLSHVEFISKPLETTFEFDFGSKLIVRPSKDAEPDDPLWHLYAYDECITLLADGTIEHGQSSQRAERIAPTE